MTISQQDKDIIELNRPHYDTLIKADFLTNISGQTKSELLRIAQIFAPAYIANLWCGPCVCDMVKFVYTQYDKLPVTQFATFPKQDESIPSGVMGNKRGRKVKG